MFKITQSPLATCSNHSEHFLEGWVLYLPAVQFSSETHEAIRLTVYFSGLLGQCSWISCRQAAIQHASAALQYKLPTMTDSSHLPQLKTFKLCLRPQETGLRSTLTSSDLGLITSLNEWAEGLWVQYMDASQENCQKCWCSGLPTQKAKTIIQKKKIYLIIEMLNY